MRDLLENPFEKESSEEKLESSEETKQESVEESKPESIELSEKEQEVVNAIAQQLKERVEQNGPVTGYQRSRLKEVLEAAFELGGIAAPFVVMSSVVTIAEVKEILDAGGSVHAHDIPALLFDGALLGLLGSAPWYLLKLNDESLPEFLAKIGKKLGEGAGEKIYRASESIKKKLFNRYQKDREKRLG